MHRIHKTLLILFLFLLSFGFTADKVILCLGDSLTEGYGVDTEVAYPALMEIEIKKKGYPYRVVNAGISGSTSASAAGRLNWFLKTKPEILILALGANDGLRGLSVSEMSANLSKAIEVGKQSGAQVILAGMKIPPNYGPDYAREFEAVFPILAKKYDLVFIPFLLEKVGGEPGLNQADRIHPNEKGHVILAQTVLKTLLPLLKK
ncbi:MAG: arylesterase [Spirochaetia bacterium]|nr:arylesterase [Spirochaetia bacterium]